MRISFSSFVMLLVAGSLPFTLVCGKGRVGAAGEGTQEQDTRKFIARSKAPETEAFRFPDDAGGRLAARMLAPATDLPSERTRRPRPRRIPKAVEHPTTPLPAPIGTLPRLSDEGPSRYPLPVLITPEPALGGYGSPATVPQQPTFPAGERVRLPADEEESPLAMKPVSQPLPDRAALLDPTLAEAREAVLAAPLPGRKVPAPYQRFTLPDPFEHRDTVRLRKGPGEERLPRAAASRPPGR